MIVWVGLLVLSAVVVSYSLFVSVVVVSSLLCPSWSLRRLPCFGSAVGFFCDGILWRSLFCFLPASSDSPRFSGYFWIFHLVTPASATRLPALISSYLFLSWWKSRFGPMPIRGWFAVPLHPLACLRASLPSPVHVWSRSWPVPRA